MIRIDKHLRTYVYIQVFQAKSKERTNNVTIMKKSAVKYKEGLDMQEKNKQNGRKDQKSKEAKFRKTYHEERRTKRVNIPKVRRTNQKFSPHKISTAHKKAKVGELLQQH